MTTTLFSYDDTGKRYYMTVNFYYYSSILLFLPVTLPFQIEETCFRRNRNVFEKIYSPFYKLQMTGGEFCSERSQVEVCFTASNSLKKIQTIECKILQSFQITLI